MDKYLEYNKAAWNEVTPVHARSGFYDVDGFKAGKCSLLPTELKEVGDVSGKSLLHLQCHFGLNTLSWARRGAKVIGVDFSDKAIKLARKLSKETGIKAKFIESDIYRLPEVLKSKFDIVFTSYGVLPWLPDMNKWAEIIARLLKRGGFFYIVEGHPFTHIFDNSGEVREFRVTESYFHNPEPVKWEPGSDYADPAFIGSFGSYEWKHSLGDIISALTGSGLKIEFLHEFPVSAYKAMPFMKKLADGWWHIDGDPIPLTFSIKARK